MLSQPVFEFTPIRVPHEAVVKSCIECSRLFPFSCSTFSKSSVCYEQAVGQRHQSQCQSIRVHAENTEQYAYQPLRHGTVAQELGLWSPCVCLQSPDWPSVITRGVHDPVAESASKCFSFALSGTRNLTISVYLCWDLAARSMTSQYSASQ